MGKKSSASNSQVQSPTSQTSEPPRMDAPPPYDQVVSDRRSSSLSIHSNERMHTADPTANQLPESANTPNAQSAGNSADAERALRMERQRRDTGCMNVGDNVDGCMNVGGGYDVGRTSGCMNYGGGTLFPKTDGCMNYQSKDGCMNYKSSGGCMNYEVYDDWHGEEGCMNYRRGGGCMLAG